MTAHGFPLSNISKFFECSHAIFAVALCTGHCALKSLESYKNLHGLLGLLYHIHLFSSTLEIPQFVKRAKFIKDDKDKLVVKKDEEKSDFTKTSFSTVTFRLESQV